LGKLVTRTVDLSRFWTANRGINVATVAVDSRHE
jgi:hypothetical protein